MLREYPERTNNLATLPHTTISPSGILKAVRSTVIHRNFDPLATEVYNTIRDCSNASIFDVLSQCKFEYGLIFILAPCQSSPCHNQGECHDKGLDVTGYQCQCQPPFEGTLCEVRQNPCVWPQEQGFCNETVVKYYYDRFTEQCLAFNYSGKLIIYYMSCQKRCKNLSISH